MVDQLSPWRRAAVAVLIALAVAIALYPFNAKPVTWDELLYMGLAFRPEPRAWRLNRYAHVYALLPFIISADRTVVLLCLRGACPRAASAGE